MYVRPLLSLTLLLVNVKTSYLVSLTKSRRLPQKNNHQNISGLLDNLLKGYDNSIRPNFGGPPATVEVDIMVRSMGPISEMDMEHLKYAITATTAATTAPSRDSYDYLGRGVSLISELSLCALLSTLMCSTLIRTIITLMCIDGDGASGETYSMDCYFRQSWIDRRLSFSGHDNDTLALSITMLERIWKPDTYFYNGKQSYLHTITTPNQFVRLYHDGRVLYSSRLTIKAGCPMNLEDFPMDIQRCPLKFGSFGYTNKDVIYIWNTARQVAIAEDMKLSQFDLIDTPSGNQNYSVFSSLQRKSHKKVNLLNSNFDEYSMLLVSFHLQRHMGNFLIQVYGPCVLLVVLSWVSFWLNREATADRVSLGITTVLTMTFLGLEARKDLPKVSYPTALDYFVFLSFSFIFATIIQFAVVHYFTKYGSGECYFSSEFNSDESDSDNEWETCERIIRPRGDSISSSPMHHHALPTDPTLIEIIPLTPYATIPIKRRSSTPWTNIKNCLRRPSKEQEIQVDSETERKISIPIQSTTCRRRKKRTPRFNSVSKIDRASRVVFPMFFLTINMFYWYAYLLRSNRLENIG